MTDHDLYDLITIDQSEHNKKSDWIQMNKHNIQAHEQTCTHSYAFEKPVNRKTVNQKTLNQKTIIEQVD